LEGGRGGGGSRRAKRRKRRRREGKESVSTTRQEEKGDADVLELESDAVGSERVSSSIEMSKSKETANALELDLHSRLPQQRVLHRLRRDTELDAVEFEVVVKGRVGFFEMPVRSSKERVSRKGRRIRRTVSAPKDNLRATTVEVGTSGDSFVNGLLRRVMRGFDNDDVAVEAAEGGSDGHSCTDSTGELAFAGERGQRERNGPSW
jgi:hypothetical protein